MRLKFTKMHGVGNDFVVLDGISQRIELTGPELRRLADRHFGVGADQILVVERPRRPEVDFGYRIFNADGGEVEQCGNGARCFVRFVRDKGLTTKREIRVETRSGVITPRLEEGGQVRVDMGPPAFEPARIPFDATGLAPLRELPASSPLAAGARAIDVWPLDVYGRTAHVVVVSMGNPHAVQLVADLEAAPVATQGPLVESHPRFPQRVNAGYMQVLDRSRIGLRVYERGTGETLACGTGACAAVVAGIRLGLLDSPVTVATRGGELTIRWSGADNPVYMTGPAETVFEGEIEIERTQG
ncbi:MAG TPA: diaminopimelate epimerase [Burkholderiales bacterium]|nr:diaminopimelate epimerase [Burkholderiales bacterium]